MRSPSRLWTLGLWLCIGCGPTNGSSIAKPATPAATPEAAPSAAGAAETSRQVKDVLFTGMCDASGAVPLSDHLFAVADDEDNVLRVYDADRGGAALWQRDVSSSLSLPEKPNKKDPSKPRPPPETDIEAATRIGDIALWLTSHGRNSSGKLKLERSRFFATTAPASGTDLQVIGSSVHGLMHALIADPRYAAYGLEAASELAPKAPGGLNIEGLTERFEGGVWIGFRNPNPGGRALVALLLNPLDVLHGAPPGLGDPVLLDLGGLGVRSMSSWRSRYLIVAGAFDGAGSSRLYSWDGHDLVKAVPNVDLEDLNPEGFFTPEARDQIMMLSDDGTRLIGDVECKKLEDHSQKTFRGRWLKI